ncbi:MAG: isochorismatase family protein [Fimbriimonadia bacterium]|jgi:nicotinamidase-related amidase
MRHPQLFDKDASALVVVDIQKPFLDPCDDKDRVVRRSRFLIQAARVMSIPILATLQYATRMGGMVPEIQEVLPEDCLPTDKLCFSCYGAEKFAMDLQASGRRQVVLCGIETHICINQTAHDLLHAGYTVGIPTDAVSARGKKNHKYALHRMANAGAILTNSESVVYEWLYQSGTPEFKQILELVKGLE